MGNLCLNRSFPSNALQVLSYSRMRGVHAPFGTTSTPGLGGSPAKEGERGSLPKPHSYESHGERVGRVASRTRAVQQQVSKCGILGRKESRSLSFARWNIQWRRSRSCSRTDSGRSLDHTAHQEGFLPEVTTVTSVSLAVPPRRTRAKGGRLDGASKQVASAGKRTSFVRHPERGRALVTRPMQHHCAGEEHRPV